MHICTKIQYVHEDAHTLYVPKSSNILMNIFMRILDFGIYETYRQFSGNTTFFRSHTRKFFRNVFVNFDQFYNINCNILILILKIKISMFEKMSMF